MRAGDLICGCCSVISVIARLKPNIATIKHELSNHAVFSFPSIVKKKHNSSRGNSDIKEQQQSNYSSTELCDQVNFEQAVTCGAALFSLLVTKKTATHVRVGAAEALESLAEAVLRTRLVYVSPLSYIYIYLYIYICL